VQKIFKDWPSNQLLIAADSCDPWHSQQGGPAPRNPSPLRWFLSAFYIYSFPFSSPSSINQKQSINQHQTVPYPESLACGKPTYTTLTEKSYHHFSLLPPLAPKLPVHQLAEEIGEHHTPCRTTLTTPRNVNQCSLQADWSLPNKPE
jgi:hypothetical protein